MVTFNALLAYDIGLRAARARAEQAYQARVQAEQTRAQGCRARAQVLAQIRAHGGVEALRKVRKEPSKRLRVSAEGWDRRTRAS